MTTSFGVNVAHNGRRWVAVGDNSSRSLAYSDNGITWTSVGLFANDGKSIAWNGVRWIAGGGSANGCVYSYDGANWYAPANNVFNGNVNGLFSYSTQGPYTAPIKSSQIILNNNKNSFNLSNKLDVVSEKYFNNGFSNFSLSLKSKTFR